MGTLVTIEVLRPAAHQAIANAFEWFHAVEACCTRFDEDSELMQLSARVGEPVPVSDMLFEIVRFAVAIADETDGAFDPTVGAAMAARGFNREYQTGKSAPAAGSDPLATYRDIVLDDHARTILLRRPLTLDLGAVAKGLAVDAAAQTLAPLLDFAIDAGGDLYLGGRNAEGQAWSVGIRHPRTDGAIVETLRVSNLAVCTSGDYERRAQAAGGDGGESHILDGRTRNAAGNVASVTVIAPQAILADALATAAFALGPVEGLQLLERHGVEGMIVTTDLDRVETARLPRS